MESHDAQLAVHDRLWAWFETHKKQVIWGAVVVLAAGLVTSIVISVRNVREANANEALSRAIGNQRAAERLIELSTNAPAWKAAQLQQAQLKGAEELLKVADDYANTDGGVRALLLGAAGLFTAEKYPEAKTQFDRFRKDYRDSPYASQAMFGAAACLHAQGQTNEAVAAYNDIVKRFPGDNAGFRAKLALARLYEGQNKLSQARDLYEELLRAFGNSSSVGTESYVHLRELMTKHPELSPAGPAATNAPALNVGQP
jgi:tetratricopeptide (TPR) repeat protein